MDIYGWYDLIHAIYGIGLMMPRIAAAFAFSGFVSRSMLPAIIRNLLAINLATFLYPLAMNHLIDIQWSWGMFLLIMAKEVFIGTFMGLLTGMIFWAVESAGFFIDNQRGGAISASVNPLSGVTTTPVGIFFAQTFITYFFISGIFLFFLRILFDSYVIWPVWDVIPSLKLVHVKSLLNIFDKFFLQTFLVASPIIITMFLGEMGLGLVNRFAPQLQVFFVSMSVKSALLFLILIFYFIFLLDLFREMLLEITLIPHVLKKYIGV